MRAFAIIQRFCFQSFRISEPTKTLVEMKRQLLKIILHETNDKDLFFVFVVYSYVNILYNIFNAKGKVLTKNKLGLISLGR